MTDQTFANMGTQEEAPCLAVRTERSQFAEFMRTSDAQVRKIVDAIAAAVANAQAGLNWLGAGPPDLEEVRQALNSIASDGKQACEIAIRLRDHMNERA